MEKKERMRLEGIFERLLLFKERKSREKAETVTEHQRERGNG